MRKPLISPEIFRERRAKLANKTPGAAVVVFSLPEFSRNYDGDYPYRQDSNLFYLTGFEEPGSVLIFRPGKSPETVMFVRERDPLAETWNGFRFGTQLTKDVFKIDATYKIEQLEEIAPTLLVEVDRIVYSLFQYDDADTKMKNILRQVRRLKGRSGLGILPIEDAYHVIGELRVIKSDYEIELMKKAADIGCEGHLAVMRAMKPGMNEKETQAIFMHEIWKRDCQREAYNPICATGANATTLHYHFNDEVCQDGQLFLIDAGAEWKYYHSDITRTYPVSGKFSPAQKDLYEGVLRVQKRLVEMVKPGVPYNDFHTACIRGLTQVMLDLGLLKGGIDENIESLAYKKYYPHGFGHFLGSDTHDAGLYQHRGQSRALETGMCFTIEPGLYIPADDETAPVHFRGLGVRIEDDVIVTKNGCDNLTAKAPKEIKDLEAIVGKR